jgi:hypothetical protein
MSGYVTEKDVQMEIANGMTHNIGLCADGFHLMAPAATNR